MIKISVEGEPGWWKVILETPDVILESPLGFVSKRDADDAASSLEQAFAGVAQQAGHQPSKLDCAGSTPVARSDE